ncbi:hypothetical protein EVAR_2247_1 [Eumeta japonica]|uniref:Uncharacterized protein n=1 Tax=Eumeta variegata TaxID=151549 RepID=A0A4C1SIA0_EUMVA|nr:hypothetical protein EVAR_2247_1 [Eumeta japonica]
MSADLSSRLSYPSSISDLPLGCCLLWFDYLYLSSQTRIEPFPIRSNPTAEANKISQFRKFPPAEVQRAVYYLEWAIGARAIRQRRPIRSSTGRLTGGARRVNTARIGLHRRNCFIVRKVEGQDIVVAELDAGGM